MKKHVLLLGSLLSFAAVAVSDYEKDKITGLVIDKGFEEVRANCTVCHSAKIITQNRMSYDSWLDSIRWMQETQGLWPLSVNEPIILDYLTKHYSPEDTGRRANLPSHLLPK
ncbi:hypothetical protein C9I98_19555 [Photobacterium sanctipauli]|uniref:Cytochrome C n=1 Tax=Photobacterium sanctipauli TaxID=1342794 RepID=A0A2T3NNB4_9GAMM|nr:hypothetical protein [Photobacterium sanctipauli]PSW17205.1 hypothetical protein C9I98_19555 [Photobacterium sanctipauli]